MAIEENVRGVEHKVATFQVGKEDMLYIIRPNKGGVTTQDDRGSNSLEERERKIKEGTNSDDDSSQK